MREKAIELMLDPHSSNFWLLLQLIKPNAQIHHSSGVAGGSITESLLSDESMRVKRHMMFSLAELSTFR